MCQNYVCIFFFSCLSVSAREVCDGMLPAFFKVLMSVRLFPILFENAIDNRCMRCVHEPPVTSRASVVVAHVSTIGQSRLLRRTSFF